MGGAKTRCFYTPAFSVLHFRQISRIHCKFARLLQVYIQIRGIILAEELVEIKVIVLFLLHGKHIGLDGRDSSPKRVSLVSVQAELPVIIGEEDRAVIALSLKLRGDIFAVKHAMKQIADIQMSGFFRADMPRVFRRIINSIIPKVFAVVVQIPASVKQIVLGIGVVFQNFPQCRPRLCKGIKGENACSETPGAAAIFRERCFDGQYPDVFFARFSPFGVLLLTVLKKHTRPGKVLLSEVILADAEINHPMHPKSTPSEKDGNCARSTQSSGLGEE